MENHARLASWRHFGLVLAAAGLLAAGSAPGPWHPVAARAASFACNQPMPPASGPGRITLAGVGYGPYHAGQDPDLFVSPSGGEVTADMQTLAAMTNYIRIYSSTGPAADIVRAAQAAHVCVSLGMWLGRDARTNAAEISAGIRLARSSPAVRSVIVGNEVLHNCGETYPRISFCRTSARSARPSGTRSPFPMPTNSASGWRTPNSPRRWIS